MNNNIYTIKIFSIDQTHLNPKFDVQTNRYKVIIIVIRFNALTKSHYRKCPKTLSPYLFLLRICTLNSVLWSSQ